MSQLKNDKIRLLESLDFIDDALLSDTLSRVRTDALIGGKATPAKKPIAWAKQIALIAACALILGAAIPVANFVLQRIGVTADGSAGAGETTNTQYDESDLTLDETNRIEHVGEVPEEFKAVVDNNILDNAKVSGDIIIKRTTDLLKNKYLIQFFDLYGNLLSTVEFDYDPAYNFSGIFETSDGKYLAIISIHSSYKTETGNDTVENSCTSKIIKFDSNGNIFFETFIENTYYGWRYIFETDIGYYFANTYIYGEMFDVTVTCLGFDGTITANKTLKGTKSDSLAFAEYDKNALWLYVRTQSSDGDYPEAGCWRFSLNQNLDIYNKIKINEDDIPRRFTGNFDDTDVYITVDGNKICIPDFDAGTVRYTIEYDDCVLIASDHIYAVLSFSPAASATISLTETVYSAYSKDGELLWRSAADNNLVS